MEDHLAKRLQTLHQRRSRKTSSKQHKAPSLAEAADASPPAVEPHTQKRVAPAPEAFVVGRFPLIAALSFSLLIVAGLFAMQMVSKSQRSRTSEKLTQAEESDRADGQVVANDDDTPVAPHKAASRRARKRSARSHSHLSAARGLGDDFAEVATPRRRNSSGVLPLSDASDSSDESAKPVAPALQESEMQSDDASANAAQQAQPNPRKPIDGNDAESSQSADDSPPPRVQGLFDDGPAVPRPTKSPNLQPETQLPSEQPATNPAPAVQTPPMRPSAGTAPENAVRLSFAFHQAPWHYVLDRLAQRLQKQLHLTVEPSGTFTYCDARPHTVPQTVTILNEFLSGQGIEVAIHGDALDVSHQKWPSADSSLSIPGMRTDATQSFEQASKSPQSMDQASQAPSSLEQMSRGAQPLDQTPKGDPPSPIILPGRPAQGAPPATPIETPANPFSSTRQAPNNKLIQQARLDLPAALPTDPGQLPGVSLAEPGVHDPRNDVLSASSTTSDQSNSQQNPLAGLDSKAMSFNFRNAPWNVVLTQFAARTELTLRMEAIPPGKLNYYDPGIYTPIQAMAVLNSFLRQCGFQLKASEGALWVLPLSSDAKTGSQASGASSSPAGLTTPASALPTSALGLPTTPAAQ